MSSIASRTSSVVNSTCLGRPRTTSRPFTIIVLALSFEILQQFPIDIFKASAVCEPISRLYFFRTYLIIASSIASPPRRGDSATTSPPREMTAISDVPPPTSTIMLPLGSSIASPAPIAAAIGSSIRYASLAPTSKAASNTALLSTSVAPEGTPIITRWRKNLLMPDKTFFRKCRIMASVMV